MMNTATLSERRLRLADMPMETTALTTERTRLHPFAPADADALLALFRDAAVRRYLLDDALVSADWVDAEIAASEARFANSGTGLRSIRLAGETAIIGFAGFREFFEPPELQLLYGLLPAYHGRGLATEVAARICDHAFRTLGLPRVRAAIDLPNRASAKVLERLGMTLVHHGDDGAAGTAFYAVERASWRCPAHAARIVQA